MVHDDAQVPRRLRRWLWLSLGVLTVIIGIAVLLRAALPPLATQVLKSRIGQTDWDAKEFRVVSGSMSHLRMVDVHLADGSWDFTADQVVLGFGLSVASSQRIDSVTILGGVWTQDLDHPSDAAAPPPSPSEAESLFVDRLNAPGLRVVVRRAGQELNLQGDVHLLDGWQATSRWSAQLRNATAVLEAAGTLEGGFQPAATEVTAELANPKDWLGWLGPDMIPNDLELQMLTMAPLTVKAFWQRYQAVAWVASTTSIEGAFAGVQAALQQLEVAGKRAHGGWQISAQGGLQQGQWQDWAASSGSWSWRSMPDGVQEFATQGVAVSHGDVVSATLTANGTITPEVIKVTAHWADGKIAGSDVVDTSFTIDHQPGQSWQISSPLLAANVAGAPSLIDVAASIQPQARADQAWAELEGALKLPEHELPMPLSAVLRHPSPERWESDLSLNLTSTSPASPRQFYWSGLAFTIDGVVDGQWSFQSTHQDPIRMTASLGAVEVRRNESAVTLEDVKLAGTYPMTTGQLRVQGSGKSGREEFTIQVDADLGQKKVPRQIHYQIKGFDLAENTLLGAFAGAMKQMPMAARMNADGMLRFPEGAPIEHQLTLQLREGRYRHPERQINAEGIAGTFAIQSFSPFVTVEDQQAKFDEWKIGPLTLSQGGFRYKLGPDGAVMIKQAEAGGLGGTLALDSLGYYPGHPQFSSVITFNRIQLSQLASLAPDFRGEITGTVSGKVQVRLKEGLLSLPKGSLTLDQGSTARLKLNAKKALGTQLQELSPDPGTLSIVEDALKDLVVKDLTIGFFDPDKSEHVCRIRIEGHSRKEVTIPKTNGGKAIAPVNLTISVDDPSEIVRRLLNLGLRKQLEAGKR